jgi:hypothetical protein
MSEMEGKDERESTARGRRYRRRELDGRRPPLQKRDWGILTVGGGGCRRGSF